MLQLANMTKGTYLMDMSAVAKVVWSFPGPNVAKWRIMDSWAR